MSEEEIVELTCEELDTAAGGAGNAGSDLYPGTIMRIVTTEFCGKYIKMPEVKFDAGFCKKCTVYSAIQRDLVVPGARVQVRKMPDHYVIWEILD